MRQGIFLRILVLLTLGLLLAGCDISINMGGNSGSGNGSCQSNCTLGSGTSGVQVFVEPNDGDRVITNAIHSAQISVWLEVYILTDTNVIHALEDDANNGLDARVMLEPHPFGGGISPSRTLDELKAAGVKTEDTDPAFPLTHEKGMIIDDKVAYIMTSNLSRSGLGGSSSTTNREYGIIDSNPTDVQAVAAIFNADWNHTAAQFSDPNLVVSPINARSAITSLIASHTYLHKSDAD